MKINKLVITITFWYLYWFQIFKKSQKLCRPRNSVVHGLNDADFWLLLFTIAFTLALLHNIIWIFSIYLLYTTFLVVLCDMYTATNNAYFLWGHIFLRVRPFTYLPHHKIFAFLYLTLKIFHIKHKNVNCLLHAFRRQTVIFVKIL